MAQDLKTIKNKAQNALQNSSNAEELRAVERTYLGSKGELTLVLRSLSKLSKSKRKTIGSKANEFRKFLEQEIAKKSKEFQKKEIRAKAKTEWLDISAPGKKLERGHLHPLTQVMRRAQDIFSSMGFETVQGPEVETEWYNFDALNIPKDHPARDMWDTFWLKPESKLKVQSSKLKSNRLLLRTHTSPVQIRYMEKHNPPLRIIAPGRIFRYEATDASHEINFYQLEGLMVGKDVNAAHFKAIIQEFFRKFFGKSVEVRLRPSYFPFTEPSFEVDMSCLLCGQKGCSGCGGDGWVELMGAGMVHPNVFKAVGYIPSQWQGFAFGMGLDRLAMMKYKINDIRLFYSGDLRFLQQF